MFVIHADLAAGGAGDRLTQRSGAGQRSAYRVGWTRIFPAAARLRARGRPAVFFAVTSPEARLRSVTRTDSPGGERGVDLGVEFALTTGNGVAVGIGLRVAEERVEAVEDFVGNGVFELLGLGIDGGPVHFEDVDEETFDEAVFAQDIERHAAALGGESDALAGAVLDVAGVGERFHHGRHGARHDGEGLGERAHRHELRASLGDQQHVLQVIFNGARRHIAVVVKKGFEATKLLF